MLPGSRSFRELFWLSQMANAGVTSVGETPTDDPVAFVHRPYRQLTRRFVEAGTLSWLQDLRSVPGDYDWVGALELCALITGQACELAASRRSRLFVITWGNNAR